MYVITHHHDYDEVLLGPIEWRPAFIASVLQSDLDLDTKPVVLQSDESRIPYYILPNVRVRPVVEEPVEYNPKIQFLNGPLWSYTDDVAVMSWIAADKDINIVKAELKNLVASERYNREIAGTTATVQGQLVSVDTNRGSRDIFVQKYLLMAETDQVEWKFPEGWLVLSKEELGQIVAAGANHVQAQFAWEAAKSAEIDTCATLAELDDVVIIETTPAEEA